MLHQKCRREQDQLPAAGEASDVSTLHLPHHSGASDTEEDESISIIYCTSGAGLICQGLYLLFGTNTSERVYYCQKMFDVPN